jgi:hypothetical protein
MRDNWTPRSQNYLDGHKQMLERQVKWSRWSDIDDYIPTYHDWEIGDTIVALEDLEFSWGWTLDKGEHYTIRSNTTLLLLDFRTINECFEKLED